MAPTCDTSPSANCGHGCGMPTCSGRSSRTFQSLMYWKVAPRIGEAFTYCWMRISALASNTLPLVKVTPGRSLIVHAVKSALCSDRYYVARVTI